jgi:hypothetical protein
MPRGVAADIEISPDFLTEESGRIVRVRIPRGRRARIADLKRGNVKIFPGPNTIVIEADEDDESAACLVIH